MTTLPLARQHRWFAPWLAALVGAIGCATGSGSNGGNHDASTKHDSSTLSDADDGSPMIDGTADDGADDASTAPSTDAFTSDAFATDASDASDATTTTPPSDASPSDSAATDSTPPADVVSGCTPGGTSCGVGNYCDPVTLACKPGCASDANCASPTPHCDVTVHVCAACASSSDCPSGQYCSARSCVAGCDSDARCSSGLSCCSNKCVNEATDPSNCGGCGRAPTEVCNLVDDNCNGRCDEITTCRLSVGRYVNGSEHFMTTSPSEGSSCCTLDHDPFFWLYQAAVSGSLVPFYRCYNGANHLYTTDSACEGASVEGTMGYIATSAVCGASPLYRVDLTALGEGWLYSIDASERDSAVASGGTDQGIVGYVWLAPSG